MTVPHGRRKRRGIQFRFGYPPDDEVTTVRGIPVTTVPRTILDLAGTEKRRTVERALNEAEFLRLTDHLSLPSLLARYPRRRGSRTIKALLADRATGRTRSELEEAFVAFVDDWKLPRPKMNEWLYLGDRWIQPDATWPHARVLVELDSRQAHNTPGAFERDRERDRASIVAGWRVIRVTWQQLHEDPAALAADLRTLCRFPPDEKPT